MALYPIPASKSRGILRDGELVVVCRSDAEYERWQGLAGNRGVSQLFGKAGFHNNYWHCTSPGSSDPLVYKEHFSNDLWKYMQSNPASLGCCMSHYNIWYDTRLVPPDGRERWILVVEGDVEFGPEAQTRLLHGFEGVLMRNEAERRQSKPPLLMMHGTYGATTRYTDLVANGANLVFHKRGFH